MRNLAWWCCWPNFSWRFIYRRLPFGKGNTSLADPNPVGSGPIWSAQDLDVGGRIRIRTITNPLHFNIVDIPSSEIFRNAVFSGGSTFYPSVNSHRHFGSLTITNFTDCSSDDHSLIPLRRILHLYTLNHVHKGSATRYKTHLSSTVLSTVLCDPLLLW
jgi:hypothetical protein